MLSRSMRKEDHAAVNATGTAAICNLCDLYTSNKLDGKWTELAEVYDQRRNMDNYREILDLKAPTARMNELNGWHLERMAVGEFESRSDTIGDDLAEIKRKSRMIKQTLNKILANGRVFKIKRDELEAAMTRQRETLTAELAEAKEFLGQAHSLSTELEVSKLAPVARYDTTVEASIYDESQGSAVD